MVDGESTRLAGRTVGVTADRRGEDQAVMWRRLGAEVLAGPAIRSEPSPDLPALRGAVDTLLADPPAWTIANTGFGMRALAALIEEWELTGPWQATLAAGRVVARGPKAAGALRSAGVEVAWRSPTEQLAEVVAHVLAEGAPGDQVALQLHGDAGEAVIAELEAAGRHVVALPVYRWVAPADDGPALALIEACCADRVDAITFTSAPGVRNFVAVAEAAGRSEDLADASRRMVVGCVGPVCAAAVVEEGLAQPVVPEHWRLQAMVKAVADALDPPAA